MTIEYRHTEYALVQGIGGHLWKWSASVAGVAIAGQAHTKAAAVAAAEKAIDRARGKGAARSAPALRLKACRIKLAAVTQATTSQ
jgi:hypothetical protein